MQMMECEANGIRNFLDLIGYDRNFFRGFLVNNFRHIIDNFSSQGIDLAIKCELRRIQFLISKIEHEEKKSSVINIISEKIKRVLSTYIISYIMLRDLRNDINNSTEKVFPCSLIDSENQKVKQKEVIRTMNQAVNLVQRAELVEFHKIEQFIDYIIENDI